MNAGRAFTHRIEVRSLPAPAGDGDGPPPAGRVVYCVPAAGAGARSFLMPFARSSLRGHLRVVQLPGREDRLGEPCMNDIGEMAALVAEAIAADGVEDYALFGHSFGALVMFETARLLERTAGPRPVVLAVAACPSPAASSSARFEDLQPADLAEALRDSGRVDEGDPLADELAALVLPALEADCDAVARYVQAPPVDAVGIPILAMRGVRDTSVPMAKMESWRDCTRTGFSLRDYDGGHFFPLESELPLSTVRDW